MGPGAKKLDVYVQSYIVANWRTFKQDVKFLLILDNVVIFKAGNISILENIVFVYVIAWFVVIFSVNTTSDISKLLYIFGTSITSGIYAKYHV